MTLKLSILEQKKSLRKHIKMLKEGYSQEELNKFSEYIIKKLLSLQEVREANCVMLYSSMPDEVGTEPAIEQLYHEGKKILLPVVINKNEMEIRLYKGKDKMKVGPYNILEPLGEPFTNYEEIDLIIVPGVAFDKEGNRLGHGRGYYDRFFTHTPNTKKIAICFPFQMLDHIPTEANDIKMDAIINGI